MKILVTGGAGFIGRHLVGRLKMCGHMVSVLDRKPASNSNPFGSNDLLSLSNKKGNNWLDFGGEVPYDIVFHLGAYVSASKSIIEPDYCYQDNVVGTLNLLEKFKFNRIVFASTAALYANNWSGMEYMPKDSELPKQSEFFDTTTISELLTPYAKSKMMGEELIKDLTNSYAILRLFNVYGEGQNPEYGAVIQSFLENYRLDGGYVIYGDGGQIRDFIHIDDVVDALIFSGMNGSNFTANVGTGVGISVDNLQKLFDPHSNVVYKDKRAGDPYYSVAETKVLSELGWTSKIGIEEGIERLKNGN